MFDTYFQKSLRLDGKSTATRPDPDHHYLGGRFITVQYGLNFSSPITFVGLRFAAAALAVTLISLKSLKGMNLKEVFAGAVIGIMIAIGYGTANCGFADHQQQ